MTAHAGSFAPSLQFHSIDVMLATVYLNAMCTTLLMYYSNQMGLEFVFFFTAQAALTRVSSHVIVVFESKSQAVMK